MSVKTELLHHICKTIWEARLEEWVRKEDPRGPTKRESIQSSGLPWSFRPIDRFTSIDLTDQLIKDSTQHGFWYKRWPHGTQWGCGGRGQGGRGRGASETVPRKASEVGARKDLEGHIFTIGSGNKGKDGDTIRTSMEKMATYIGTKYGNEAAQEWTSGKKITLSEPAYSQAIRDRHAARVKATREQIELRLKSLRAEKTAIEAEINQALTNCGLLKELQEVDNQIARGDIKLNDKVKIKLTDDERMAHSNMWRTHQEPQEKQGENLLSATWPVHPSAGWQDEARYGLGEH